MTKKDSTQQNTCQANSRSSEKATLQRTEPKFGMLNETNLTDKKPDLQATHCWKTKEMAGGTTQHGDQDASAAQRYEAEKMLLCLRRSCISWQAGDKILKPRNTLRAAEYLVGCALLC